jgi:pimeloyl-ACP methyl ester carboxylesterase
LYIEGSAPATTGRKRARYDVTHVVDEPGRWLVSAGTLLPAAGQACDHLTVLCCTPGGACTGRYFDLGEPDAGYSFAQFAVKAGFACVMIDNLGTGQSTPQGDRWLSPRSVARAGAEAFALAVADLRGAFPGGAVTTTIGVGHSMGAMLTLLAQSMTGRHTALACLGFTPAGLPDVLSAEELRVAAEGPVSADVLESLARRRFSGSGDPPPNQPPAAPFPFNLPNTDREGLAALAATNTNLLQLPGYLSLLPGNVIEQMRRVTVPVFLGGGDHEPWHRAGELVPAFSASNDITFYTLTSAAHNHNVAATRQLLWRRLLAWATEVTANPSEPAAVTPSASDPAQNP